MAWHVSSMQARVGADLAEHHPRTTVSPNVRQCLHAALHALELQADVFLAVCNVSIQREGASQPVRPGWGVP
eukprot:671430-Rhodomonas_salina.3